MEYTFVNFSNHPSDKWETKQRQSALAYGEIVDLPFPEVDAEADETRIEDMAAAYVGKILDLHPGAVLCQGEFCLAFQVASRLKAQGVTVLAACSRREVKVDGNRKETIFEFVRFRKY